jgi:hypothetical protein
MRHPHDQDGPALVLVLQGLFFSIAKMNLTHPTIAKNSARSSLAKAARSDEREKAIRAILAHPLPAVVSIAFDEDMLSIDLLMEALAARGHSHGERSCCSIIAQALVTQAASRIDASVILCRAVLLRADVASDLVNGCTSHICSIATASERKVSLARMEEM